MNRSAPLLIAFVGLLSVGGTGCMPKMTVEELKAGMPQRPAELDRLDALVGTWEYEGQLSMAMLEGPLATTGKAETVWDGDKSYLVSRAKFNTESMGDMQGLEIWTYDSHAKKYRSAWVDSMGSMAIGESTYDPETETWHSTSTGYGPWGKTTMKGYLRFIAADTVEYSWTEYQGLTKTVEYSGTGQRHD